jgi:hypothetical protein
VALLTASSRKVAGRQEGTMRTVEEIRAELDRATTRRSVLWSELSRSRDGAAELALLNERIPQLWEELRIAGTRSRHGAPEPILQRAARERRLEREIARGRLRPAA